MAMSEPEIKKEAVASFFMGFMGDVRCGAYPLLWR